MFNYVFFQKVVSSILWVVFVDANNLETNKIIIIFEDINSPIQYDNINSLHNLFVFYNIFKLLNIFRNSRS